MGFTEKQKLLLFSAWNRGYLSDPENYEILSQVSGLSRKQISNWARIQITKLGDRPLPQKSESHMSSILDDLPAEMRTLENYSAFRILESASTKRRKLNPKRTKIGTFTAQQNKVLFLAWEKGFLCDNQHYGALSAFTGLTRKQISNWARTRINRGPKEHLPRKNLAPISIIFKDSPDSTYKDEIKKLTHVKETKQPEYNARQIKQETVSSLRPQFLPRPSTQLNHKESTVPSQHLPFGSLYSGEVTPQAWRNSSPRSATIKFSTNNMVPNLSNHLNAFQSLPPTRYRSSQPWLPGTTSARKPAMNLVSKCVIQNALKEINQVDDKQIEVLAILTNSSHSDVVYYLLGSSWRAHPVDQGILYKRNETKKQSSSFVA